MGSLSGKKWKKRNARSEQNGNRKNNTEDPRHNSYLTFDDYFFLIASQKFMRITISNKGCQYS